MIFFTYSGKDTPFVDAVYEFLERNDIKDIWYAPKRLRFGDQISFEIEAAIKNATTFAFFNSANSLKVLENNASFLNKERRLIKETLLSAAPPQFIIINIDSGWETYSDSHVQATKSPSSLVIDLFELSTIPFFGYIDLSKSFRGTGISPRLDISENHKTALLKFFK